MPELDPSSPEPLHYQLTEKLRSDIVLGKLVPGDKLPSEEALIRTFAVSRSTVRQAIMTLRFEGLVRVEHGIGTFVNPLPEAQDVSSEPSLRKRLRTLHSEVPIRKQPIEERRLAELVDRLKVSLTRVSTDSQSRRLLVRLLECINSIAEECGPENE